MTEWVTIAIVFVAGMASAILLLGAVTVWRIVWPIVTDDPDVGRVRFIDESHGDPRNWRPARLDRLFTVDAGIRQEDDGTVVLSAGTRYRWDGADWRLTGADWDAAPPWATALLENTKTSDIIWADGHCTGARMQWIYCTAKTLNGKEFTMTRPEHWRVVEWRPGTRQGGR